MNIKTTIFPRGLSKCVLMSFDDGNKRDLQTAEIMEQYGIKGTFHINSGCIGKVDYLTACEIKEISKQNEIAVHTVNHINITSCPFMRAVQEIVQDKAALEELTGKIIRGMAFPFGKSNEIVENVMPQLGFEYARKSVTLKSLVNQSSFFRWTPTCHIEQDALDLAKKLVANDWINIKGNSGVLFLMDHSCQLKDYKLKQLFIEFCKLVGNREDIWYATCIEYVDYINAIKHLQYSHLFTRVYNPSAIDVWIMVDDHPVKIESGNTIELLG